MHKEIEFYDQLAENYDLMVDWESRLAFEAPFLLEQIGRCGAKKVLDLACGTGMHSIFLAQNGLQVVAVDPSENMLAIARRNAGNAGAVVDFARASFGELLSLGKGEFDVIFCLGNSLPHVPSEPELENALLDVFSVLRRGGLFVTQNRNYDKVWAEKNRFMPMEVVERRGKEVLFFRMLDFHEDLITFNIVTLTKAHGKWSYTVNSTRHRPVFKDEIERLLLTVGLSNPKFYGDLQATSYDSRNSGDLVVVAEKGP